MRAMRPTGTGTFLTREQEEELARHLSAAGVFTAEDVEDMVWDLQHWWPSIANPVRAEDRESRYRHFSGMVAHARALQNALASERPLAELKDMPEIRGMWERFETDLSKLIKLSEAEIQAARPKETPGRGRPPEVWRDNLITLVHSRYPKVDKRGLRAHFEHTVILLLGFLNAEPGDVRATIRDVLKRKPRHLPISRRI